MVRRLHPCRLIAVVTGLLTLYSFARVAVLFFEALSVVQSARIEDESLLQLCSEGLASGSAKMREACLKARSDRASPIFFKAIVHAVGTAFKDFSDTVGSPFKLAVLALFVVSSITLPIVPWARMLFGQYQFDGQAAPPNGVHYIGFAPPDDKRGRVKRRFNGALRALRMRRSPLIEEWESDLEPGQTAIDVAQMPQWNDISLTDTAESHPKWD
jgi:hypothetical protein